MAARDFGLSQKAFGDSDESFNDTVSGLRAAFEQLEKLQIYEGLPGSGEGKNFVEEERKSKPSLIFDDNWFYLVPQSMAEKDSRQLQQLFSAGLFVPWRGVKFCGGFHADYAVAGEISGRIVMVMFCLGCHEARIVRVTPQPAGDEPVMSRVTVDLADGRFAELRTILLRYRKLRPIPPPRNVILPPPPTPKVPLQL